MKVLADREVWFVTGSQALYGDDALRTVAEHSIEIAHGLDDAECMPVRVVPKPVVTTSEAIREVLLGATAAPECVGVIAWMHTFSPSRMWIPGLTALQKPLLHLHTQYNRDLPWGEIDMDFMNLNQSAHGDREFGYIESRLRLRRTTVVGYWRDPDVAERVGVWARAACGLHELRRLRLARFGDNMRQVAVTEGDKVEAQIQLGVRVDGFGVGDLVAAVDRASADDVDRLVGVYDESYELAPALRPDGDRRTSLRDAARIEVGLRSFLEEGGYCAFTDTFEDLGSLVQLPGIGVQRLMADGYGFGAEGDWKTALLVRAMKVMATGLPGGTSFMEDYTYHLSPDGSMVLGAHMLEVCPSIADGRPSCEIHPLSIGGRSDPVRLVFTARQGPGIVVGLLDLGDRFRLVLDEIDIVTPPQEMPRLPVARAVWEPRPGLPVAAEAWLLAGGPHHTSLSTALTRTHIEDFAEMAGIELVAIGEGTTVSDIKKELRWNYAYHQLARGP
ncbi:MAG TPA: L-arabinose isomerase [Candidatus Limnocylindrales bacterium]|nr:L-arabinose isomerase [Candidatus Limnocylindrales bacterium]